MSIRETKLEISNDKIKEDLIKQGCNLLQLKPNSTLPDYNHYTRFQTEKNPDREKVDPDNFAIMTGETSDYGYALDIDKHIDGMAEHQPISEEEIAKIVPKEWLKITFAMTSKSGGYRILFRNEGSEVPNFEYELPFENGKYVIEFKGSHLPCSIQTGNRCRFVAKTTNIKRVLYTNVTSVLESYGFTKKTSATQIDPELLELGVSEGGRNRAMWELARIYLHKDKMAMGDVIKKIQEINQYNKPPLDESELMNAIKKLANDNSLKVELSKKMKVLSQKYSWSKSAESSFEVYRDI